MRALEAQGCDRLLLADDGERLGLCKIALYDNGSTLAVRSRRRITLAGRKGEPTWTKSVPGPALILSFRGGRLSVYESFTRHRRRYLLNATPSLHAMQAVVRTMTDYAFGRNEDSERLRREIIDATCDALVVMARRCGVRLPADPYRAGRVGTTAVASYPLLAEAVDAGAQCPDALPTTLTPILRALTPADAARRAFGRKGDLNVSRALMSSLTRDAFETRWIELAQPVNLFSLALARMGRTALDSDGIATVLTAPGPIRAAYQTPDDTVMRRGRVMLAQIGGQDTLSLLLEAIREPNGPARLTRAIRAWHDQDQPDLAGGPNGSIDELDEHLAALYDERVVGDHPLAFPAQWHNLDGTVVTSTAGDATLRIPTSTLTIGRWGRQLINRLGEVAGDAVEGLTWVLGVEVQGEIRSAVTVVADSAELTPWDGMERLPTDLADAVVATLDAAGLLNKSVRAVTGAKITARVCHGAGPRPEDEQPF